ncbi:MAG: hypothetical protein ACI8UO_005652 [Verrucomicrobiales bacterium]|jgi:hypothetical protein
MSGPFGDFLTRLVQSGQEIRNDRVNTQHVKIPTIAEHLMELRFLSKGADEPNEKSVPILGG